MLLRTYTDSSGQSNCQLATIRLALFLSPCVFVSVDRHRHPWKQLVLIPDGNTAVKTGALTTANGIRGQWNQRWNASPRTGFCAPLLRLKRDWPNLT